MTVEVVRLDDNGRIYLPASVRKNLRSREFYVEEKDGRIILIPVREKLMKYRGTFRGENLTGEEIDEIVKEETEKLLRGEL
ncbi:AbrB/MazE/SpoVT family DNA-binding domain-containing protein [Thermococcus barossii]|uniref:AbrB/MazE/SpoVT family DNA-binding domain-containing protein n=1 Tax=Thermococcus barossii TaxID=54077 RepID=UPI001E53885F|nr:AbrB/MazE/SpoVT family DNA-binding domain-containing protein [Thermococcus barossii]